MKAALLIAISVLWPLGLAALGWWQLHSSSAVGWGVDMPMSVPRWVAYVVLVASAVVIWLGWIIPLVSGIRLLARRG